MAVITVAVDGHPGNELSIDVRAGDLRRSWSGVAVGSSKVYPGRSPHVATMLDGTMAGWQASVQLEGGTVDGGAFVEPDPSGTWVLRRPVAGDGVEYLSTVDSMWATTATARRFATESEAQAWSDAGAEGTPVALTPVPRTS